MESNYQTATFDELVQLTKVQKMMLERQRAEVFKCKKRIKVLAVLLVLCILCAGFFAYMYVTVPVYTVDDFLTIQTMPDTGELLYSTSAFQTRADCPLKIITSSSDPNGYYIKILRANTGAEVCSTFIRPRNTLEMNVPDGEYIIRYAYGTSWYGEDYLFGSETCCYEFDKTLVFYADAQGYNGYTIEIFEQYDGNLNKTPLSVDEF